MKDVKPQGIARYTPMSMESYHTLREQLDAKISASRQATLDSLCLNGRVLVYPNQVPYDTDILRSNLYLMTAVDALAATVLGVGVNYTTMVRGFPCVPVSPPGLAVLTGSLQTPDILYSLQDLDATDYGSLPADTTASNRQYKQGFNYGQVNTATPAPVTPGNTVIHLIQVAFETEDVNDISRPYFNSTNPAVPIFENNYDTRTDSAIIEIKLGVEAPSPTPPTPDPGFIALYYVEVAYGQTSIVNGNITKVSTVEGQPFITQSLTNKISNADISGTYATIADIQTGQYTFGGDVGTPGHIVTNPAIPYPAYGGPNGLARITVDIAPGNTNPGAADINVSGLGVLPILKQSATGYTALTGGELRENTLAYIQLNGEDGVAYLLNPFGVPGVISSWNGSTTPVAVTGSPNITITGGQIVKKANYARVTFTAPQTIAAGGTPTKILFDSVVEDDNGWWDPVNNWFLPDEPGKYRASLFINSVGTSSQQILEFIGNGPLVDVGYAITNTDNLVLKIPSIIQTSDGSTTTFYANWINNAIALSTDIGSAPSGYAPDEANYFEIEYLGS